MFLGKKKPRTLFEAEDCQLPPISVGDRDKYQNQITIRKFKRKAKRTN
jgi:hypothetical protein